jgi:D-lactate dehydrogenase
LVPVVVQILRGFGCEVLAFDPFPDESCRALCVRYVSLDRLFGASDIITLHCPLTLENHHLINAAALAKMKPGAMLINTSRGGLLDTRAVIDALKSGKLGHVGLDVYEEESEMFFEDLSGTILRDDIFTRLLTFPNVLITGHQGFFTREALDNIASTTIENITQFEATARRRTR